MQPRNSLAGAALLVALVPCALAQGDAPTKQTPVTTTVQVQTMKLVRGADMIGKDVTTPQGEQLGKVADVVVHPRGDISFLIVAVAGALTSEAKMVPVPWGAARKNDDGMLVVDVKPKDFSQGSHNWTKDNWPKLDDVQYWTDVDNTWSRQKTANATEASAKLAPAKCLYRGSELDDKPIETPEGQKIATIDEFVVDPRHAKVSFVVLKVGDEMGAAGKRIAVPWDALKLMPSKENAKIDRLTLSTTKEKLEAAPEFVATSEGMKQINEPDYLMRVYEYYSIPAYWKVEAKPVMPKDLPKEEKKKEQPQR